MEKYKNLDTPSAVVDLGILDNNIVQMIETLKLADIKHRPHIKAHKSVRIAKRQLELGASGITCAKLSEAEIMADAGINNILLANEIIGDTKWTRLLELSKRINLTTVVDSFVGANGISQHSKRQDINSRVLIDVDLGAHRCGLSIDGAIELYRQICDLPNLEIFGVFGYASLAYGCQSELAVYDVSKSETDILLAAKAALENIKGEKFSVVSSGASFGSRIPKSMLGVTESRAGNYVFNDATALRAGVCSVDDCALRIVATIISNPEPGRIILDAGSKALSSDGSHYDNLFGLIVEYPEMEIYKLNEEHAYVRYPAQYSPVIGEKVTIIPNHSCVISNLFGELISINQDGTLEKIQIECRGALK